MQGAVWWLRLRLVKLLNAKNPWKIPAWPENSVSTQQWTSVIPFWKAGPVCIKKHDDQIQVLFSYQTYQGHRGRGLGVEHHSSRGISFRDEANAKDTADFCIFFRYSIIHLRKFENFEVIAIFKEKDLKGLLKYFLLHGSLKDRVTMLLSFHVFSIKNWHPTSLIVVIQLYSYT